MKLWFVIYLLLLRLVQGTVLSHHRLRVPHRVLQVCQSSAVLTGVSSTHWARRRNLDGLSGVSGSRGLLECGEESLDGLGSKVLVVVVVDLDHRGVDTGAQALDLDQGEESILGGVSGGDTEVFLDSFQDLGAAASSELAWRLVPITSANVHSLNQTRKRQWFSYRCAKLNEVFADRLTVVHGIESSDFVDTHGGHLQEAGDLVHDANACEAVLTLAQIQERHDCSLLVLGGVALEDLIDQSLVLLVERERDARVVGRLVAVLGIYRSAKTRSCNFPLILTPIEERQGI